MRPEKQDDFEEALAAIDDPVLRKSIIEFGEKIKHSAIVEEAKELAEDILKKPIRPEQQILAFIPHQMAKVSIFFPMSDKDLKEKRRLISRLEQRTNWGKIEVQGIKLAIYEEDILLAILLIAKNNYKKLKEDFLIETHISKIDNLLYGPKGYTKRTEEVILRALDHFGLVSFKIIVGEWKKRGKERLNTEKIKFIGGIISGYKYDEKTKSLKIRFNPDFFIYFLGSMLTNINFTIRRKLKKDGSKALLRFLSAHSQPGKMHILTVLNAINFNTNQPMFRLRDLLKSFIRELKLFGVLGKKTKIYPDDTVYFDIAGFRKSIPDNN